MKPDAECARRRWVVWAPKAARAIRRRLSISRGENAAAHTRPALSSSDSKAAPPPHEPRVPARSATLPCRPSICRCRGGPAQSLRHRLKTASLPSPGCVALSKCPSTGSSASIAPAPDSKPRSAVLMGVAPPEYDQRSLQHDFHVKPNRPIAQVFEVVLYAQAHLFERRGLASKTMNLCPATHPWPHLVPDHVAANQLAVHLIMRHGVRAWTDEAHVSFPNVEKLREFVHGRASQKSANPGKSPIPFLGLRYGRTILAHRHAAEFVDDDLLAMQPIAALLEQDGTGRGDLYSQRYQEHDRPGQQQRD